MKGFSGFKSPLKNHRSGHYKRDKHGMEDTKEEQRKKIQERRERKKEKKIETNPKSEKERYLDYLRHTPIVYPNNIA